MTLRSAVRFWKRWRERKDAWERDLDAEIQTHLSLEAEENIQLGLASEEAEYAARRAFGNKTRVMEEARKMSRSGFKWFEDFGSDAKYGLRRLARSPQLALAAMLSLGLAVGINTTI